MERSHQGWALLWVDRQEHSHQERVLLWFDRLHPLYRGTGAMGPALEWKFPALDSYPEVYGLEHLHLQGVGEQILPQASTQQM